MGFLKNLRVGVRLGLAFAVVLALLLAMAATGAMLAKSINYYADYYGIDVVPSLRVVREVESAVSDARRLEQQHLLTDDDKEKKSLAERIGKARDETDRPSRNVDEARPSLSDGGGQRRRREATAAGSDGGGQRRRRESPGSDCRDGCRPGPFRGAGPRPSASSASSRWSPPKPMGHRCPCPIRGCFFASWYSTLDRKV